VRKLSGRRMGLDVKVVKGSDGATLSFEEKMWKAADKLVELII